MNGMERSQIREKVCKLIAEVMEEEYVLYEENAKLIDDIGLDSMGFLELAIQIQRTFDTLIPNEEWENISTLEILIDVIEKKMEKNEE